MKDINDLMPKIPNMRWGALLNYCPTNAELKQLNKMMPQDKKWHTILQHGNETNFDGKIIRKRTADSMT